MTRRSLHWPKLLGCILGLEALGIFMCQAPLLLRSSENTGWPTGATTWFWLLFATSLSVLGYFVYRAHNWARLTVIASCVCLCIRSVWGFVAAEIGWAHMLAQSHEWELGRQVESAFDTFGMSLSTHLVPLALIIGVLCHRDVAAAFRPAISERSNQSLEPTAGRCDDQI